jgi:hypothetical protein
MAWAAPFTWATGDPVTAGKLNQGIRDNARFLYGYGQEGQFAGRMAGLNYAPATTAVVPFHGTVEFDPTGYLAHHMAGTALPWQGMPLPVGYHVASIYMDTPTAANLEMALGIMDNQSVFHVFQTMKIPAAGPTVGVSVQSLICVDNQAAFFGGADRSAQYADVNFQYILWGVAGYINTRASVAQIRGY